MNKFLEIGSIAIWLILPAYATIRFGKKGILIGAIIMGVIGLLYEFLYHLDVPEEEMDYITSLIFDLGMGFVWCAVVFGIHQIIRRVRESVK